MADVLVIDALAARLGGTAYAVVGLARRLAERPDVEVHVITREGSLVARGLHGAPGIDVLALPRRRRFELPWRLGWEAFALPRELARRRAGAVLTYSGMLPRALGVPVVSYVLNPVPFERSRPVDRVRRAAIARTARTAAAVIAPSRALAEMISRAADTPVQVLALGVDHEVFAPAEPGTELLYVADAYPHKRHDLAVEAWRRLPEPRPPLHLVCNPDADPRRHARIVAMVERLGDEVRIDRRLSLPELAGAYRRARAFILPSEHESFSMPLLESLAAGVPAVARDTPALRETGGPATTYVTGDDPDAWAAALRELVLDDEAHAQRRAAGLEHARRFSWDAHAEEMHAVLRRAMATIAPVPRPGAAVSRALAAAAAVVLVLVLAAAISARPSHRVTGTLAAPGAEDGVIYGDGIRTVVRSPVASLAGVLGDRWRRLAPPVARVAIQPAGRRERFFTLGVVGYAPRAATRLTVTTSRQETGSAQLAARRLEVLHFGPFVVPDDGAIAMALAADSPLELAPLQAEYLAPGEAIVRQAALREDGPGGLRGLWVPLGRAATLRVAPGIRGRSQVRLLAAGDGAPARITVSVGRTSRRAVVGRGATALVVGPFRRSAPTVTVRVERGADRVLLAALAIRHARSR